MDDGGSIKFTIEGCERKIHNFLGKNQVDEAIQLVDQLCSLFDNEKLDGDSDTQNGLDVANSIVGSLEGYLESVAYTWDYTRKCNNANRNTIEKILRGLCLLYKCTALATLRNQNLLQSSDDEIADNFLDWAIAAKRAGSVRECIRAHARRMEIVAGSKRWDAVRLLGVRISDREAGGDISVEEVPTKGLFETSPRKIDGHHLGEGSYYAARAPTENGVELGRRVAKILANAGYGFRNCGNILKEVLSSHHGERQTRPDRIYSANSFFNHRREALASYEELTCEEPLKVLAFLFLFGISLGRLDVAAAVGDENVEILFRAGVLCNNPVDKSYVVGEVQIYPLNTDTFEEERDPASRPIYLMTDWSVESLRMPRDAVMAVGYDSLELAALTSGTDAFSPEEGSPPSSRVLDLCCGCGIQGIFAARRSAGWDDPGIRSELVSMDVNPRACRFAIGNACLNGLVASDAGRNSSICCAEADLYEPVDRHPAECGSRHIGRFDCILCNPPFVAVPFANIDGMAPALYSAGGGHDGMHLLRRILGDCFVILRDGTDGRLLMVTELPNIESSCELLGSFLPAAGEVRVAYIEDDVELTIDYAKERETEAGFQLPSRDWNPSESVRNRALALISISRSETATSILFCLKEEEENASPSSFATDEEDLFLTMKGIQYARDHIL